MFFPDLHNPGIPELASLVAILAFLLIIVHYLISLMPLYRFRRARIDESEGPPVSVIICARNEDEHLTEFLPKVLSQDYPQFEVVVVNDCSWDSTETVIDEFAKIFPNLRKANIKEDAYYKHGKKFAMLVGIKASRYEHLVFTDADCYPVSTTWLREMAQGFAPGREIVLGYGGYDRQPGFLNKLIRFDTFMIGVNYLSAALRRKPYMGVGRNLAYTKSLFFRNKGFSKHYHLDSGDDDLLVNEASTPFNVNVCVDPSAITRSRAEKTFRDWRLQKARHLTTAPFYRKPDRATLTFNYFSQYFFYLSLIPLAFSTRTVLLIPVMLVLKMTAQYVFISRTAKRLGEQDLVSLSPLLELILLFIYPIFHVTKIFGKKQKWNH